MELQSQHGGPGGGGVVIHQQPSSLAALEGRLQYERELQQHRRHHHLHHHASSTATTATTIPTPTILSLDQIKAIRSNNEYTEGPAIMMRRPPSAPHHHHHPRGGVQPLRAATMATQQQDKPERTHEVILVNVNNNNYEHRPQGSSPSGHNNIHNSTHHQPWGVSSGSRIPAGLSRSTSTGSAASSDSSASSEQGLLLAVRSPPSRPCGLLANRATEPPRPVRTQPKPNNKALLQQQQQQKQPNFHGLVDTPLKPPSGKGKAELSGSGGVNGALPSAVAPGHQFICERCGKCKCGECTAPRALPAHLACGGHCLCSAESALEHGTCMCLVKGIFYHCAPGDDDDFDQGDSCADHPCSLSRSHCCQRFLCMGLMSALFPCLLCYPPVKGCLKACQGCYDRVNRPGCRCKNSNTVYCKLENWGGPAGGIVPAPHHHRTATTTTQEKPS